MKIRNKINVILDIVIFVLIFFVGVALIGVI